MSEEAEAEAAAEAAVWERRENETSKADTAAVVEEAPDGGSLACNNYHPSEGVEAEAVVFVVAAENADAGYYSGRKAGPEEESTTTIPTTTMTTLRRRFRSDSDRD